MATQTRGQASSPLLGIYFGIFVAGLVAAVILLLIFEQLGADDQTLRNLLLAGSMGLFALIGVVARTSIPAEFFLAGRRVPAFFSGLILAIVGLGGTGLMACSGALFLIGFDALCLMLGMVAGFVVLAVLIAPYYRKFGAISVPAFLGQRFESRIVRLTGASVAVAALLLASIAEMKAAMIAASWLAGVSERLIAIAIVLAIIVTLTPGGTRSLTWSSAAQGIAAFLALMVPVGIAAVFITNLPLGQLSHGPVLRALSKTEVATGITAALAPTFAFDLPGEVMQAISGRFLTPNSSIGAGAFLFATLAIMVGIAGSPTILPRTATTVSVYETRKSLGWTVFLVGSAVMTFSAIAVFTRDFLMGHLVGLSPNQFPGAVGVLADMGLVALEGRPAKLVAESVLFKRDGLLLVLPVLMGFPSVLVHLVAAGILAAALAAAMASLAQLGIVLVEDVVYAVTRDRPQSAARLHASRVGIVAVTILGGWLAVTLPSDPLSLMLWALALSGNGLFPVLLLSIWWKRLNGVGAVVAMLVGLGITVAAFVMQNLGLLGSSAVLVAVLGVPCALLAAIAASYVTAAPGRHILEMVRDLRIPGGEAIADREARRLLHLRLKRD